MNRKGGKGKCNRINTRKSQKVGEKPSLCWNVGRKLVANIDRYWLPIFSETEREREKRGKQQREKKGERALL